MRKLSWYGVCMVSKYLVLSTLRILFRFFAEGAGLRLFYSIRVALWYFMTVLFHGQRYLDKLHYRMINTYSFVFTSEYILYSLSVLKSAVIENRVP